MGGMMKTVQMTLDEDLILSVDKLAKRLGTTRSAFTRQALKSALREARINELERKHREGYKRKPVKKGEFGDWEAEQIWVEP
jgi:metal-responsive CopG/Arc/MetJ family transcriptional regulator